MNPGLTSALLILVVYAQAATHGIRLTVRMLSALLISAFAGALLTSVCADLVLRPGALLHLLWLVAAVLSGCLAGGVCAYVRTAQAGALWRLSVCTNFGVMLITLPDPFMPTMPVQPDPAAIWSVATAGAAAGTAVAGGTLVLIASALHNSGGARPTTQHAFMTVAVLCMVIVGFAAWLPAGALTAVQLPATTLPDATSPQTTRAELIYPAASPGIVSQPSPAS